MAQVSQTQSLACLAVTIGTIHSAGYRCRYSWYQELTLRSYVESHYRTEEGSEPFLDRLVMLLTDSAPICYVLSFQYIHLEG